MNFLASDADLSTWLNNITSCLIYDQFIKFKKNFQFK